MLVIHSSAIPADYLGRIKDLLPGLVTIPLPASHSVYRSISSHPDIFFFQIDKDTIIHSPDIDKETISRLASYGINMIPACGAPCGKYPGTSILNAARVGNCILHNIKNTDPVIIKEAESRDLRLINCRQGYCRCSLVTAGADAIITSDKGIEKAAIGAGINVLGIDADGVALAGEKRGFIGGATGILPEGGVLFLGGFKSHPDYSRMDRFLSSRGISWSDLPGLPLYDSGSLIFI